MKYYLINGKIMKGSEVPIITNPNNDSLLYGDTYIKRWLSSLKQCEISESELDKIYEYLNIYSSDSNPIDVTNIIDENSKSGLINFYVEPKQVDEASEAVIDLLWTDVCISIVNRENNKIPFIDTLKYLKSKYTITQKIKTK